MLSLSTLSLPLFLLSCVTNFQLVCEALRGKEGVLFFCMWPVSSGSLQVHIHPIVPCTVNFYRGKTPCRTLLGQGIPGLNIPHGWTLASNSESQGSSGRPSKPGPGQYSVLLPPSQGTASTGQAYQTRGEQCAERHPCPVILKQC
jgi:hypothetical protein